MIAYSQNKMASIIHKPNNPTKLAVMNEYVVFGVFFLLFYSSLKTMIEIYVNIQPNHNKSVFSFH